MSDAYPPPEIARKVERLGVANVTAGNVAGGTLLVAGVSWLAYLRGERANDARLP